MPPTEKEKAQKFQEKFQAILSALLKEEDNKYCADCAAFLYAFDALEFIET